MIERGINDETKDFGWSICNERVIIYWDGKSWEAVMLVGEISTVYFRHTKFDMPISHLVETQSGQDI